MGRLPPEILLKENEVMPLARSLPNLTADGSPAFYAGRKLSEVAQALLQYLLKAQQVCKRAGLDPDALVMLPFLG
jgi:hypothetical protein